MEICDNDSDDNNNGLIDGDDPQCNTSSGVQGGLESNRRLSDKIALRNFKNKIENPDLVTQKELGLIPFYPSTKKGRYNLSGFIPQDVLDAYVAQTTPSDLIDITNAEDVAAADYYVNNQRVASILAINESIIGVNKIIKSK